MKEFFSLLKQWKLKAIFFDPTDNGFLQFFRYLFVGGIATVVDWLLSFGAEQLLKAVTSMGDQLVYVLATTAGFAGGLVTNFLLSKAFVFAAKEARANSKFGEFMGHFMVGAVGLGMSYLIVWAGTKFILNNFMLFRIISTIIVFVWNYLARKFFVYKT